MKPLKNLMRFLSRGKTAPSPATTNPSFPKLTWQPLGTIQSEVRVTWPNRFRREPTTGPDRLALAPAGYPLRLQHALAAAMGGPYFMVYVHLVSHGPQTGRYEYGELDAGGLAEFLNRFSSTVESDARHELWVGNTRNDGMVVYDHHGILYAYGPLGKFEAIAREHGLEEGDFEPPFPHAHHYYTELDSEVENILSYCNWRRTDLRPEDDG